MSNFSCQKVLLFLKYSYKYINLVKNICVISEKFISLSLPFACFNCSWNFNREYRYNRKKNLTFCIQLLNHVVWLTAKKYWTRRRTCRRNMHFFTMVFKFRLFSSVTRLYFIIITNFKILRNSSFFYTFHLTLNNPIDIFFYFMTILQ